MICVWRTTVESNSSDVWPWYNLNVTEWINGSTVATTGCITLIQEYSRQYSREVGQALTQTVAVLLHPIRHRALQHNSGWNKVTFPEVTQNVLKLTKMCWSSRHMVLKASSLLLCVLWVLSVFKMITSQVAWHKKSKVFDRN